eukprot:scaffold232842_cov32-Tisochrysis_lutea.AAC.1
MAALAATSKQDILASLIEDGLPEDMATAISKFADGVNDIEERVRRLQQTPWSDLCQGLSPLESARLHLMVAYTINTLFYMYLKTQGIEATNHPVMEELDRVKAYVRKVKEVTKEMEAKADATKAQISLNASAAQRFIAHALGNPEIAGSDSKAGIKKVLPAEDEAKAQGEAATAPADEFDGEFSRGVVERLDRERAATAAAELAARIEQQQQQQTGRTSTGDEEKDGLVQEIEDEMRKYAVNANSINSSEEKPKKSKGEKGSKRSADGFVAPKGKVKKDKKSARAMGER